jgi:hypothetical protein
LLIPGLEHDPPFHIVANVISFLYFGLGSKQPHFIKHLDMFVVIDYGVCKFHMLQCIVPFQSTCNTNISMI